MPLIQVSRVPPCLEKFSEVLDGAGSIPLERLSLDLTEKLLEDLVSSCVLRALPDYRFGV
jgi:hypothetical protein